MTSDMTLSILSPIRRLVEAVQIKELMLTGSEGQIQILPGHAPIIGMLETGPFSYLTSDDELASGAISSGFFQVENNQIIVTVETAEFRSEIDLDRAKKAQNLAEDKLKQIDLNEDQFKKYQLKLQRAIIRQQVANKN